MSTENGQKIQKAIRAVCNMHADVSKLLVEFSNLAPWPCDSVFQNYATRDLTYNVRLGDRVWMPDGVYRYLSCKSEPTLIEAAMVCFVSPRLEEPALILARLKYQDTEAGLRTVCKEWDLWYLFFDWNQGWEDGKPMNCSVPTPDNDRIQWVRAVHVPLYSVTSMDMIRDYLERLRSHSAGA